MPCLVFVQVLHEGIWAVVLRTAGVLLVQRAGCAGVDELVAVSVVRMHFEAVMCMQILQQEVACCQTPRRPGICRQLCHVLVAGRRQKHRTQWLVSLVSAATRSSLDSMQREDIFLSCVSYRTGPKVGAACVQVSRSPTTVHATLAATLASPLASWS